MEEANTRRILAVALDGSAHHLSKLIKDLTGTAPTPASSTLAGTTHHLALGTPYYSARVPVWLDVIASPAEWASTFLSDEAREVLSVLGGVIVVFPASADKPARDLVRAVGEVVRDGLGGWEWDGVGLAVGVGEAGASDLEGWEDLCDEWKLEFVHDKGQGGEVRNEFGEKVGIPRVLEGLQSNNWSLASGLGGDDDSGSEFGAFAGGETSGQGTDSKDKGGDDGKDVDIDPESLDFGFDREDFAGLRKAIWTAGKEDEEGFMDTEGGKATSKTEPPAETGDEMGEEDVQKIEQMMRKLQTVRDMSAGLPDEQRKRLAKQAVGEVMKEI